MQLYKMYRPITATPYTCDNTYMEIEPCEALKPYISCFWGTPRPVWQRRSDVSADGVVIPDTCADIIFDINFTDNTIDSYFCGVYDQSFYSNNMIDKECLISTFAIRFYSWSAVLFAEDSIKDTGNQIIALDHHFGKVKREIGTRLFDVTEIHDRVALAQQVLIKHIHLSKEKEIMSQAIGSMIEARGNLQALQLAKELFISNRQLERIFRECTGTSPKKMASLIRYQCLWHDIIFKPHFHIQDEVDELGYVDQAHLLKDFKRFHGMTIKEARSYALKDVEFLQADRSEFLLK